MTRTRDSERSTAKGKQREARSGPWMLQDAKARLSELVRRAHTDGPQHVVCGDREVVVISADEFQRLTGDRSGMALIAAMQASPHRDIEIAPRHGPLHVRDELL